MTSKASELLSCPFCGGEAKCNGRPDGIMGQIYCDGEECFGPKTTALTKQDSIVQWNTRSTPANSDMAKLAETASDRAALADRIEKAPVISVIEPHYEGQTFPASANPLSDNQKRVIVAALRQPPSPGEQDGREAIARIINPIAFTALERCYSVPAPEEFMDMKIAREKADAILALRLAALPPVQEASEKAVRETAIFECADIARKYDDCGGQFIAEKISALASENKA